MLPYRRRATTTPCNDVVDPALNAWSGHLATVLNRATKEACIKFKGNREFSNVNGILRLGRQMLAKSIWVAIPTDKDGGMGLFGLNDCRLVLEGIVQRPEYNSAQSTMSSR